MKHYHIDVVVNEDDIRVIKEQFNDFIEATDGFTVSIVPDNDEFPSEELDSVLKKMFIHLIMTINCGKFKGVH